MHSHLDHVELAGIIIWTDFVEEDSIAITMQEPPQRSSPTENHLCSE